MDRCSDTLAFLDALAPGLVVQRDDRDWGTTLTLRAPAGAEYQFSAYLGDDGDPGLGAHLLAEPETSFWSQPYEAPDFASRADQVHYFQAALRDLIVYPTRIRYRRGLLKASFTCEALTAGGWQRVGGSAGYLRLGGFRLPRVVSGFEWRSDAPASTC